MKPKKKSQIALEYLILIGIVIAALTPLTYSQINKYVIQQRINDANRLANDIAKAADALYSLGPGNQKYMYIDVPKGISNVNIYQREISFTIETSGGDHDIILLTKGYVTGVIPIKYGTHRISMRVLGNGMVLIGFPYCGVMSLVDCDNNNLNPLVYLQGPYASHVSLYNEEVDSDGNTIIAAKYGLCCKNSVKMVEQGEDPSSDATTIFWLNNDSSSPVSQSDVAGYDIPIMIQPINLGNPLSCTYDINQDIAFCAELGPDYHCIATIEDNYVTHPNEWDGSIILNSHISDCDDDFDDYPIKICCIIPPE